MQRQDDSRPATVEDAPLPLREQFIGQTGRFMVQIFPKENIWDRDALERFIKDLRKVYRENKDRLKETEEITGTPVTTYEYTLQLKSSYVKAAFYALGAVVLLAFLHFGCCHIG